MQLKPGTYCPLVKEDCLQMRCAWFTQLRGRDANTGKDVDEWACAVAWLPMLLIENAQQGRSAAAAVESMRNENVGVAVKLISALKESPIPLLARAIDDER
jgi:hypothetical protein